jgi:galactokinase
MDQLVSSVGRENELLGINCNINEIEARIPLPKGLRLWAVDSGALHCRESEQYSTIRAAAFMGMRYLEEATKVLLFATCLDYLFTLLKTHQESLSEPYFGMSCCPLYLIHSAPL